MTSRALITGSAGLVGSAVSSFLCHLGWEVLGIDNFMRAQFFGEEATTGPVMLELTHRYPKYRHLRRDIRDHSMYDELGPVDLIVHAASQPSHDWAAEDPMTDWEVNATATLNLLEWYRHKSPEAVFIYMSTNKVYGDSINRFKFVETSTRYEPRDTRTFMYGVDENLPVDRTLHSLFGVSKTAGDLMTQEYGKYFGLKTICFRCGCLTGVAHRGAKQHGFLSYMAKCIRESQPYTIIGYDGKQVRDNLHADDVATACWRTYISMHEHPLRGEVFNLGGGRNNSTSVVEALTWMQQETGNHIPVEYDPLPRKGDHIWWISDTRRFDEWASWRPLWTLEAILKEIING